MPTKQPASPAERGGDAVELLLGSMTIAAHPRVPFDEQIVDFLSDLSGYLLSSEQSRAFPDLHTFAFWCRRANLSKLKSQHQSAHTRLGLGLLFHIAPSNAPINFAYSLVFGLLSGNANIVRLPSRPYPQVNLVCNALKHVLAQEAYQHLAGLMTLVRYPADSRFTAEFSARCDGRIIWGGDATVRKVRSLPIGPRARELTFPDRYSLSVLGAQAVLDSSEAELGKLADRFFNDAYVLDQNACSSPHLVFWLGENGDTGRARVRFWEALKSKVHDRYDLKAAHAVSKYTDLLVSVAGGHPAIDTVTRWGNEVYTLELGYLPEPLDTFRGRFGSFREFRSDQLDTLALHVNDVFQTLTYFGVDKDLLRAFVIDNRLTGIDRIVPVGSALDISTLWDGFDVIASCSRIIDCR